MNTCIIGAGISGVSAGRLLSEAGMKAVIYEKNDQTGGLVRCEKINGNLFHKVGGHVFNSKITRVSEWFWNHFDRDKEFIKTTRKAKILLKDKIIGYPIENYVYELDKPLFNKILTELTALEKSEHKSPFEYPHFEAFLKENFGSALFELYFGPYNRKIWSLDLKTIPMSWLEGKLPMPDHHKILESITLKLEDSSMAHSSFYYPKNDGSQFIIDRLAAGLEIKINYQVEKITRQQDQWFVNGEGPFDNLIYTGDIRNVKNILDLKSLSVSGLSDFDSLSGLRSNGTTNAFCYTDDVNFTWMYIPGREFKAHRIIYTGNFSPTNNSGKRKTCVVEYSGKVIEDAIRPDLQQLPGNLQPMKFNYEPSSYIIQDLDTRNKINWLKNILLPYNFFICGRFAEWEYYNMDNAIEASMKVVDQIISKDSN